MKSYIKSALAALVVAAIGITWASRDGSGTYSLPAGNPVVTGTTIDSTWANTTLSDIGTALTNSLAKDGQTVPTANLPMGGFKHTNVANATSGNQYAAAGQVQSFSTQTLTSVSGTNAIVGSLVPSISSYTTGMPISFVPANSNTGATTLSVNGLTARAIVKRNGTALIANDLVAGIPALVVTSGTQFVLLNPLTDMSAAQVLAALLTVDGSGSGLDADLLDGQSSAYYQNAANLNAGSIPNARVPQAAVTQHQAALSIATSQLTGNMPDARIVASNVTQHQGSLAIATSQVTSGTFADARISSSSVTQHMDDGYARNITGKAGVTKTLSSSSPTGGSDGDVWYKY